MFYTCFFLSSPIFSFLKPVKLQINLLLIEFSDKYDYDNVREGFSLVKKRMSLSDYEEFKSIISRYIDLDIIEEKI